MIDANPMGVLAKHYTWYVDAASRRFVMICKSTGRELVVTNDEKDVRQMIVDAFIFGYLEGQKK